MAQLLNDGVVALRAIEPTDLDVLTSWENDTSLWELGCTLAPYSRKRLWDYIENYQPDIYIARQLRLVAVDLASGTPVGTLDFYDFDPHNRRAGVGVLIDRDLFVRSVNDKFNLANFMRAHLHGAVSVLKIGNDILFNEEKIKVDRITGHGGLFKTKGVGQRILAAALNSPISVMETAGEGGAWGMALLGSYLVNNTGSRNLADFLDHDVFAGDAGTSITPTKEEVEGFNAYLENYKQCLGVEIAAVEYKK